MMHECAYMCVCVYVCVCVCVCVCASYLRLSLGCGPLVMTGG